MTEGAGNVNLSRNEKFSCKIAVRLFPHDLALETDPRRVRLYGKNLGGNDVPN